MIYLAFYRGEGRFFSDTVVQYITRSEFSHCEMFTSDEPPLPGETHRCITAVGKDGGVRIKDITFQPSRWEFVEVPWAPTDTISRARQNIGSGYDFWGLLMTQFLNLRRHAADKWFCSKLCAYALGLSEAHTYAPGDLKRVVTEHNRIFKLAQINGGITEGYRVAGDRRAPLPGGRTALDGGLKTGAGLLADYARDQAAILNGEGQWQPHINQAAKQPVRGRKALRANVTPAVITRREGARLGGSEPLQLNTSARTASGEVVDFNSGIARKQKLD